MFRTWQEAGMVVLLFALIAAGLLGPISSNLYVPNLLDYTNHLFLIMQAKAAFLEGQFPLRTAPDLMGGLRVPLFQFYSPTSYTFAGILYALITPDNPFTAYKLTLWVALTVGGCYFYRLVVCLTQERCAAILASLAYLTTPVMVVDINHVGAFNEAIAFGMLPLVLYYSFQCFYFPNKIGNFFATTLAWYVLVTVHPITIFYASIFIGLLFVCLTLQHRKHLKGLLTLGGAYFYTMLLAAWYLVPVLKFSSILIIAKSASLIDMDAMHPTLASLLAFAENISGGIRLNGVIVSMSALHPGIGLPLVVTGVVLGYAFLTKTWQHLGLAKAWIWPLCLLFGLSFLMVWTPLDFWAYLPRPFRMVQYSWRLLGQVSWIGCLLFAFVLSWMFPKKMDIRHVVIGAMLILFSVSSWFLVLENGFITVAESIGEKDQNYHFHADYIINPSSKPKCWLIDRVPLGSLFDFEEGDITLNENHKVVGSELKQASHPIFIMNGLSDQVQTVDIYINNQKIASKALAVGEFHWELPLDYYKNFSPFLFRMQITSGGVLMKTEDVKKYVMLGGLIEPDKLINMDTMQKVCHQQGETTDCKINVPSTIQYMELPVVYYPGLLSVRVNGKPALYGSVLYGNKFIVGIKPVAGKENHIEINFTGSLWANLVSNLAWGLLGILILYTWVKRRTKHA